jgi:hypothetical protein
MTDTTGTIDPTATTDTIETIAMTVTTDTTGIIDPTAITDTVGNASGGAKMFQKLGYKPNS